MMRAVRAEFLKFFTTRMWWGMAIATVLAAAGFSVLFGFLYTTGETIQGVPRGSDTQVANSVYTAGISVGYLLLLTIGVMQIGQEYRHQTITGTFLAEPRRTVVLAAKVVALLGLGAFYGLISLVGSVLPGALVLHLRGAVAFPGPEVLRTLALSLLVLGLWALIGLGVGILIPNQVAALLIGVGMAWIVEPLIGFALAFWDFANRNIVPYLPSEATQAVINAAPSGEGRVRLDWWVAALVLIGYAALLSGLGSWRAVRQDVS